jgi:hypothetical protein
MAITVNGRWCLFSMPMAAVHTAIVGRILLRNNPGSRIAPVVGNSHHRPFGKVFS